MKRTSVYLRPDARDADIVRIGTLYLSRTTDRLTIYLSFMAENDLKERVDAATESAAMRTLLADFGKSLIGILPETSSLKLECEEAIIEALFGLLPTNLKHHEIEDYPAEDFFVRAIRENQSSLRPETVSEATPA